MKLKFAVLGLAALGSAALASGQALAAMPNGIPQADKVASGPAANVDQVRMVCNAWGRCWWRPNYYGAYAIMAARDASTVTAHALGAGAIATGAAGK